MRSRKPVLVGAVAVVATVLALSVFIGKEPPSSEEAPAAGTPQDEVCTVHLLPVAECLFCDPALREPGRLWCEEHDRYEDRCFICHPDIREADRLWCQEHSLYEDECSFCHPELRDARDESKGREAAVHAEAGVGISSSSELECLEHRVLERECGICQQRHKMSGEHRFKKSPQLS